MRVLTAPRPALPAPDTHRGPMRKARVDLDEWAHLVRLGEPAELAATRAGATDLTAIRAAAVRHSRDDVLRLLREATTGEDGAA